MNETKELEAPLEVLFVLPAGFTLVPSGRRGREIKRIGLVGSVLCRFTLK